MNLKVAREEKVDSSSSTIANLDYQPKPTFNYPPPNVPGYDILEEIGRGGMGIVYKAHQPAYHRHVAIKVIRKDRLTHADSIKRFRREAQAAQRLAHPNVVLVYDSDHEGDTHYLVMEYVDGITLERLVQEKGPLPVEQACDFIRQAALGLQHAYEQALVHRDIKPSNLMVTTISQDPSKDKSKGKLIKILDMGVARLYQMGETPIDSLTTLTQPGSVVGTADFIAPEQLEDPHRADFRADLYSLGCTFYFLLTGQVPFPGGTLIQKLDRQRWESAAQVNQVRSEIPPAVVDIVHKLMAKKPGERFQTPGELALTLDSLARTGKIKNVSKPNPMKSIKVLKGHAKAVWCVAASPQDRIVASGSQDRSVILWNVDSGKDIQKFEQHSGEVRALAFSPDGKMIVAASGASLRLWDISTGKTTRRLMGHSDTVRCVQFSRDGQWIISGGEDRSVRVWNVNSGRETVRFSGSRGAVSALAIHPEKDVVLIAGRDAGLRLWDFLKATEESAIKTSHARIHSVGISADGLFAFSTHFDTFVRLWDLQSKRDLRRFQGHRQMVTSGVFTLDGRHILTGSQDQTLRLWNLESGGEEAGFAGHEAGITSVTVIPGTSYSISAGFDHTLRVWKLDES